MPAAALPLTIAVHANQIDTVEEVCSSALGCGQSDLLGQLLILVAFGLVTVFLLAALHRVTAARAALTEERSRTATEQEAFSKFARAVDGIDPSAQTYHLATAEGSVTAAAVADHRPSDGRLQAVREAYRETVMSMPHFDEEYAEPIDRHLQAEFGEEVATAVVDGEQFTPELKAVLVERADEAAWERERLMHRLDREADWIDTAEEELTGVDQRLSEAERRPLDDFGYHKLADEWNRLGELDARIQRLVNRRQEAIQSRQESTGSMDQTSLASYLYGDVGGAFPVLADAAVLADRVKAARSRVLRRIVSQA